jgi:hypothetical protein
MCRNTSGKLENYLINLINHFFHIYGIFVYIRSQDRNQIHIHECKIIYEGNRS